MDGIAAPKKRKKGAVSELFISQTVYFVVVTIAVLCFKFFGGELYADFKSVAVKQLSDTTDINLVLDEVDKSDSLAASSKAAATKVSTDDAAFAEYAEDSSEGYVFDLAQVRLLSSNRQVNSFCSPVDCKKVHSMFGYRYNPVTGKYTLHSGVDIGANTGDNVYAALDATVVKAKYSSDYGNFVMLDHGEGFVTLYAHCSKLLVEAGDKVKKGDVIALAGSTGQSTGPHLHFEVRINGTRIDPQYYLSGLYEA